MRAQIDAQTVVIHVDYPNSIYYGLIGWSSPGVYRLDSQKVPNEMYKTLNKAIRFIIQKALLLQKLSRIILVESAHISIPMRTCIVNAFRQVYPDSDSLIIAHLDSIHAASWLIPEKQAILGIDLGYNHCSIMPVYDHRPLFSLSVICPAGISCMIACLKHFLLKQGKMVVEVGKSERKTIECSAVLPEEKYHPNNWDMETWQYVLKALCILTNEETAILQLPMRYKSVSILLHQSIICETFRIFMAGIPESKEEFSELIELTPFDEVFLVDSVIKCLKELPLDLRKVYWNNILITGNIPNISLFERIFLEELKKHWHKTICNDISTLKCKTSYFEAEYNPSIIPWLGGVIFGSFCSFADNQLTFAVNIPAPLNLKLFSQSSMKTLNLRKEFITTFGENAENNHRYRDWIMHTDSLIIETPEKYPSNRKRGWKLDENGVWMK